MYKEQKVKLNDSSTFLKIPNNVMKCWRTPYSFPVEGRPDSLKAFCMKPLLEQRSFAKSRSQRYAGCCWRGASQSRACKREWWGHTSAGLQWSTRARQYDLALVSGMKAQVLFTAPCCFKHVPGALNKRTSGLIMQTLAMAVTWERYCMPWKGVILSGNW